MFAYELLARCKVLQLAGQEDSGELMWHVPQGGWYAVELLEKELSK